MILPFSTQLNGKLTYFVERIWEGLLRHHFEDDKEYIEFLRDHKRRFGIHWDWFPEDHDRLKNAKIHTIRTDQKERWKPGTMIDFFINCRQKNMFRFAPRIPVVSVQEIFMTKKGNDIEITISKVGSYIGGDDFYLYHDAKVQLALNDGFDSLQDFNLYFLQQIDENFKQTGNSWFKGKIIHWTDKRY